MILSRDDEKRIAAQIEAFESALAERAGVNESSADPAWGLSEFAPPPTDPLYGPIVCELIRVDLERGWSAGRPRSLEEYRERYPRVFDDPELTCELAFEEWRQRRLAGHEAQVRDYLIKFAIAPDDWPTAGLESPTPGALQDQLLAAASLYRSRRLGDPNTSGEEGLGLSFQSAKIDEGCASLFLEAYRRDPKAADRLADSLAAFPEAGQSRFGFQLLKELGRGAMGRVFLAKQNELAGRLVALKIAANVADESSKLARLRHPHIVPIHSIHHEGALQAVCMPYLGSTTLADVVKELRRHDSFPDSGRDLLSPIRAPFRPHPPVTGDGDGNGESDPPSPRGPHEKQTGWALDLLSRLDFVPAVLWIGARLADGLAFAHENGIIHGDLKPANILMTDDGQPMLLDFNLATDLNVKAKSAAEAWIGGTLPYMAPEHLQALVNRTGCATVQGDLFAIGVVLYELLTGRKPFPNHSGPPRRIAALMVQDRLGPPPGLRRWNRAITPAVKAVILRCLEPDPAKRYASARELCEDLTRQLEHRPLKFAVEPKSERARKWLKRRRWSLALAACAGAAVIGYGGWRITEMRWANERRRLSQEAADRQALDRLSAALVQSRTVLSQPDAATDDIQAALELDEAILREFKTVTNESRDDLVELALLAGRASARLATPKAPDREQRLNRAFELNRSAESISQPHEVPAGVWAQRARLERLAGRPGAAAVWEDKFSARTPQTRRERYLFVLDLFERRDLSRALDVLARTAGDGDDDPQAWLLFGNLYRALSKTEDARVCYDAALRLDPKSRWARQNRGLLRFETGEFAKAIDDFSEVIRHDPSLPLGWVNRALARIALGDHQAAIADLSEALKLPNAPARCWFLRADQRAKIGDRDGADQDRARGLSIEPNDERSWVDRGLARLSQGLASPPKELEQALEETRKALELNPDFAVAWHNQATLLSALQRDREAILALDQALRIYPNLLPALLGRAVLEARSQMRDRAIEDADRAMTLSRVPDTLYRIACVYALTSQETPDDAAKALDFLEQALKADPETWLPIARTDPDLDPIRNRPEFPSLLMRLTPPTPRS